MTKWARKPVEWVDGDTAYISVVFTWHVDYAYSRAVWLRQMGYDVKVGGPGVFTRRRELSSVAAVGGDIPDAVVRHNPLATFASKGCPVGCYFCIVPAMEGREFTLLPDFEPRPVLCDNNLSGLPASYQDYVVERYLKSGVPLLDANSGFEPATFDEDVLARWQPINRGPWRFAYDESDERDAVHRVTRMLADMPASRKRVYVLIGNEPFDACMGRIREVIEWGCEPHVQPIMKLNARRKVPWVRYDWNVTLLRGCLKRVRLA